MKKTILIFVLFFNGVLFSQTDIDQILEIGVENAQRFSEDYFAPAGEALINTMSNGWFTTAETKKLWHFNVGFVGNLSFVREDKQSFLFRTAEYTDITLPDGSFSQFTSSALGSNSGDVTVIINEGSASQLEVVLPDGIGNSAIGSVPSGFLQGSLGLIKSTEIKVRFLPRIKAVEDAEIQLYGVAFQHELTDWIFRTKRWPVKLSALLGYTNVKGFYDLNGAGGVPGTGQEVELNSNSWLLTSIVSTKMPILNFYGGLGYYFGSNNADLLGTYQIQNGPFASVEVTDPISVRTKTKGVKATLGARVVFGSFNANLDYSFQNFNNLSLGLRFAR